jgi:4-oxalocrotonate tautomerase
MRNAEKSRNPSLRWAGAIRILNWQREEIVMPIVQISMIQGRTPEKKEQLIKKVTEAIIEVLKVPADRVRIVLNEVPKENLGYGGVPLSKVDL